jgi:SAM-dependent methyltransferase
MLPAAERPDIMSVNDFFLTEDFQKQHTRKLTPEVLEGRYSIDYVRPGLLAGLANPKILDIACGAGQAGEVLMRYFPGADYTGLDFSPAMLAEARRLYPRRQFRQFEFTDRLPFDDGTFDLVYHFDFIEHSANPYALLREGLRTSRRFVAHNFRCSRLDQDLEFRKKQGVRFNILSWRHVRQAVEDQRGSGLRVRFRVVHYQPYHPPGFEPVNVPDSVSALDHVDGARKVNVLFEKTQSGAVEWIDETALLQHRGYLTPIDPLTRVRRWFHIAASPEFWSWKRRHRKSLH